MLKGLRSEHLLDQSQQFRTISEDVVLFSTQILIEEMSCFFCYVWKAYLRPCETYKNM